MRGLPSVWSLIQLRGFIVDRRSFLTVAGSGVAGGSILSMLGCGSNTGGPSGDGGEGGTIKLVSSMPRTGSAKGQTDTIVNGIRMAIDEYGAKIGSFTIEYLDADDATAGNGFWTAELESKNAREAIADTDVMAY